MAKVAKRVRAPDGVSLDARFADIPELIDTLRPTAPVYALFARRFERAVRSFLDGFPGTTLYAVKANPAGPVLDQLHAFGIRHFDTASQGEVELVRQRFPGAACYFMAPIRPRGAAGRAAALGVRHFVIDDPRELATVISEARAVGVGPETLTLFVRLAVPSDGAALELSSKFGTDVAGGARLLCAVAAAGAQPALTFHVGSLCLDPVAYERAMTLCGEVLAQARVPVVALDVGGGFPAPYPNKTVPALQTFFDAVARMRGRLSLPADVSLYCEPGRALVAEGVSVITQVMLRRNGDLYLNDGIYGSLDEMTLPGWDVTYPLRAFGPNDAGLLVERSGEPVALRVWGPTCDTLDKLPRPVHVPGDVQDGDWIEFGMIGAYSCALRTGFNGFYPDSFVEVMDR